MATQLLTSLLQRFQWYCHKHGFRRLFALSLQKATNRWILRSKYLFVINLSECNIQFTDIESPLQVEAIKDLHAISESDLKQFMALMGPGIVKPFLDHFFSLGACLWVAKLHGDIVGIKWTLRGGFSGFYCMPIASNDVVSIAEQVFQPYRGQGLWGQITAAILARLKEQGVSRVYFGVHCRNKPMLSAVQKASVCVVGRVLTFRLLGCHFSIWRDRYLWRGQNV